MNKIFKYQQWHILSLIGLLVLIYTYSRLDVNFINGSLWGISTLDWYLLALFIPILHQFYVLIVWRSELHYKSVSKLFGAKGFRMYQAGFFPLFVSRLITIIILAISSTGSFNINPILSYIISGVLFIPAVYLFYSVKKYFGIDRACGIDHFEPEEAKKQPFVNQGIFKYSANAMYKYGFFILWIPGVWFQSTEALSLALFNHIYIWVHYYFTELPDIRIIYGEGE